MKRRQNPTPLKVTELGVPTPPPTVIVNSSEQSGGITAHTVNIAPTQSAQAPSESFWKRWGTRLAAIAALVSVLTFFGMKLPDWFRPESNPNTMSNDKPHMSISSDKQSGGVTAGTVGTVNINTMQPQVEGVRVYTRQVPSPREDAPYAIEITVQVSAPVQPFGVAVLCDKEIVQGAFSMVGNSVFQNVTTGYLTAEPKKSYIVAFGSPAITPSTPFLVTIMCKEPFNIVRVSRQSM
jgi:ribosomal protein L24